MAEAFSAMLQKLQASMATLEQRVGERTAALADANERLQQMSRTDPMTGLANRRRFNEALDAEWAHSARDGTPLALLVCDVDLIKDYNDCYGHVAGDACLMAVARALETAGRRSNDVVARIGGKEFGILLPDTRLDEAGAIARRVCASIRALAMAHARSSHEVVTASVGVACAAGRGPGLAAQTLMHRADTALYQAKQHGRNQVAVDDADTSGEDDPPSGEASQQPGR